MSLAETMPRLIGDHFRLRSILILFEPGDTRVGEKKYARDPQQSPNPPLTAEKRLKPVKSGEESDTVRIRYLSREIFRPQRFAL
jgi:hypothetical protein